MKMMLWHKIGGLALLAALLPVLVVAGLLAWQKPKVEDKAREVSAEANTEVIELSKASLSQILTDVYSLCDCTHKLTLKQTDMAMNVAWTLMETQGPAQLGAAIQWEVPSETAGVSAKLTCPKLLFGTCWPGQERDPQVPMPIVDEVHKLTSMDCSIMQLTEAGDLIRVASSVVDTGNKRVLGALITANSSPAPAEIRAGRDFRGVSRTKGRTFISYLKPIRDAKNQVVGALGVGTDLRDLDLLRETLRGTRIGRDGYIYVLQGQGEGRGSYVISRRNPDGSNDDGKNLWDSQDATGRKFIQDIVNEAVKAPNLTFHEYSWKNSGESVPREKIAAVRYFEPWDWVLCTSLYKDNFGRAAEKFNLASGNMNAALDTLMLGTILGGLVALLLVAALSVWMGRRISAPIGQITQVAQTVADGDLYGAKLMASNAQEGKALGASTRETSQLLAAIQSMIASLNSLVGQVQRSSVALLASATEIAATARQQEGNVNDLGTSTSEIAAATKEISATSQDLVKTMGQVTTVVGQTTSMAGAGRNSLVEMENRIRELAEAARSISGKLAVINDKASSISAIMTTINKVADQTNLLSLNAAIEAEKAGEQGLGFSVVAREIRRLADQTAVATLDIAQMIKETQSAVGAGVMEMDKFSEAMRRSVEETQTVGKLLTQIIAQVQELTSRFHEVEEGMRSQSEGARQISEAMTQLTDGTQKALTSLREFNKVTEHMHAAVRGLKDEVSRFKVRD